MKKLLLLTALAANALHAGPNEDLLTAVQNTNLQGVEAALAAGADANAKSNDHTPLMLATRNTGRNPMVITIIDKLVAKGAKVDAKRSDGRTALMLASLSGNPAVIDKLIALHADVNATDNHGLTALMDASLNGRIDIVEKLIAAHANVNAKNIAGLSALGIIAEAERTPLHHMQNWPDVKRKLVAAGAK